MKSRVPAPKKVLIVTATLLVGGVENLILDTASELARRRKYVPVVCNLTGLEQLHDKFRAAGVIVHSLNHRNSYDSIAATMYALRSLISEANVSLIHAHQFTAGIYGRVSSFGLGIPVVCHTHNTTYPMLWLRRWLDVILTEVNTKAFIAVTNDMANNLLKTNPRAKGIVHVLYNAVDESRISLPPGYDAKIFRERLGVYGRSSFVVGAVGRLDRDKQYDFLIQSFAILLRTIPDAWLIIVGSGLLEAKLREQAHELDVDSRVIFTGYRDDIGPLMSAFDILAISSQTEAFPLVALEALSCGTPIVMTNSVSAKEVLEKVTITVPKDVTALAHAMCNLYRNPALGRELSARGRKFVKDDLSLSMYVDHLENLYDSWIS